MADEDNVNLEISETKPWSDLPQEILGLFIERLHYADQIRFRAVCKGWRLPNDFVKCSRDLPWAVSLENYPSLLELFDPHSQKSYKVTNPTDKFQDYINIPGKEAIVYASKNGWLLIGKEHSSLLLHNPFSNETIFLPSLASTFLEATFTTVPKSPDCEVLVFSRDMEDDNYRLWINRYCISSNTTRSWSTQLLEKDAGHIYGIQYLNGKVYCLWSTTVLSCYDLADKSWTYIYTDLPVPLDRKSEAAYWDSVGGGGGLARWGDHWLTGTSEDLIMVCGDGYDMDDFMVFRFDWGTMRWDFSGLEETALFMKDKVVLSLSSSQWQCGGRMFCVDVLKGRFDCIEFNDWEREERKEYSWIERRSCPREKFKRSWGGNISALRPWYEMSFIQPPN